MREVGLAEAFEVLLDGVGETRRVEIEIISSNRGQYSDLLFDFDKVIGYAVDLRLIEYRVEDEYLGEAKKKIIIYPYGENGDDPTIIRRESEAPSNHFERFFRGSESRIFQARQRSDSGRARYASRDQDDLPAKESETKLLGSPSVRPPLGNE